MATVIVDNPVFFFSSYSLTFTYFLCRCFGAPARRVSPDHLIITLLTTGNSCQLLGWVSAVFVSKLHELGEPQVWRCRIQPQRAIYLRAGKHNPPICAEHAAP